MRRVSRSALSYALALVVAIAAALLVSLIHWRTHSATTVAEAEIRLGAVALLKADLLELWLAERLKDARGVATSPAWAGSTPAYLAPPAAKWLETIAASHAYEAVEVLAADGSKVWRLSRGQRYGQVALDALAARTRTTGKAAFELRSHEGNLGLFFAHPIEPGDLVLLLVADAGRAVRPVLSSWPASNMHAEIVLARRSGDDVIVLRTAGAAPEAREERYPISEPQRVEAIALRGGRGLIEGTGWTGARTIAVPIEVAGTPWVLLAKAERGKLLAPVAVAARHIGAIVLLLFLVGELAVFAALRRREARRLAESEARFRRLYERSPMKTALARGGVVISANPAFSLAFGSSDEDLAGARLDALLVSEGSALVDSELEKAREQEVTALRLDGSRFPAELTAGDVEMPDGRAQVIFVRDISERLAARRALEQSRDFLLHLFDRLPNPVWRTDPEGSAVYMNAAWLEFRSARLEDEMGSGWMGGVHPDDVQRVLLTFRGALERRAPYEIDHRLMHRSGEYRWVREFGAPYTDPSGSFAGFLGSFYDIHGERVAEGELRRSESRFRSMIESSKDLIVIVEWNGTISYVNPVIRAALGYAEEEVVGQSAFSFVHRDDGAEEQVAEVRAGTSRTIPAEVRVRHRDASWRHFQATASPLDQGSGSLLLSLRDVTEMNRLELALDRARRVNSLGWLSANIAHEFANILMGIQPFAEAIDRSAGDASAVRQAVQHINRSLRRGKDVTQQILRFVQPSDPVREPLELGGWLSRIQPEIRAIIPPNVELRVEVAGDGCWILADGGQLVQVLTNLVTNAVHAMPDGGTLTIAVRAPGDALNPAHGPLSARLIVRDTGSGISDEVVPHIFEPLFTTKKSGGTGLGLPLVHQIVQKHGGEVLVDSAPREGSTFELRFPLTETREAVAAAASPAAADRATRKSRLLFVEDDDTVAEGVMLLLELEGIDAVRARDGARALSFLEIQRPDAVVLDIGLPDMDGIVVFEEISRRWPGLPVVFSTGQGDQGRLYRYLSLPNVAYLLKPYDIQLLLDTIARLTGASAA